MDQAAATPRRRATDVPPSGVRRRLGALRRGLYRTLAEDDDRAAYWVRHVRIGVVLTEVAAAAGLVYVLLTPTPVGRNPVVVAVAVGVMLLVPAMLRLPLRAMMRDRRGPLLFYAWSIGVTLIVVAVAILDGASTSPLHSLLFLALGFLTVAYPPYGVVAMGSLMTLSYVLVVATDEVTLGSLFIAVVMGMFTVLCAVASANSWAAHDRQVALIRQQEVLATTDELTGSPNRRAFLERVGEAIAEAAAGRPSTVCLVDLDGFKAVNDTGGHRAGDAVLKAVAAALSGAVRDTDTVARLGGDEFAVLAERTPDLPAERLAERLRAAVAAAGARAGVTASVGTTEVRDGDDLEALLHRADEAMYRAKAEGGDRVVAPPAPGTTEHPTPV
ncbi:GGDEF domain-containing protein [Geodermatophilus sp. YIM 151500]|uniref:GGDEF domain-containing protein n=1 Tax=Geodermatophilus sp. YIM 151500 TaxID=2984531 RepID=UPI0021E3A862|nr:GGDEF domain-containing protein [Geodermatophilus sp. YIM 151500]MCV2489937.1 GGDEF domain-containing protein [Geodermatophilus sp. YIM 151500]